MSDSHCETLPPLLDLELRQAELLRQIEALDLRVEKTLAEVLRQRAANEAARSK
ncbi:MAG: hypothetical protein KF708_00180 [Pirellulales bacterium]|nr:hypothetical protein [Pirellulales bacterium]